MFKLKNLLLFGGMVILAIAGCKPGRTPISPTPLPPAGETPIATLTPAPQVTPTPLPQATPTEEPLKLEKISAGLEKFSSYRLRWSVSFDGKDEAGNPVKWEFRWTEEYTANPPARRLTFEGTEMEKTVTLIYLEDKTYALVEDTCLSGAAPGTENLERFTPEFGISGGTFVGYDTIAGIKAKHYTFDEKAFTWGNFAKLKGEIWVAPEGYALKEIVEAYGKDVFYNKGEGTLRWAWEVIDINKPLVIELPPECTQLLPQDIPILPNASDMTAATGFITYKSSTPFREAVEFYKEKMPANGWTQAEGSMEMESMAMLNFSKAGRNASILIQAEADGVAVMITIGQ